MGNTETNNNFFRKFKYNLLIDHLKRIFQFVICFITWRLISATCEELDDKICADADNFLHLSTETHESHTCLTLAKNPPIIEKLFPMVALKSTTLHLLSATSWE